MSDQPDLLALDFDGVLCDGLREYFQTAWKAHCHFWEDDVDVVPPQGLAESFYRLRPIVETGWEMPVIIHALRSGFSEAAILRDWSNLSIELLEHHQVSPQVVAEMVDRIRDHAIHHHLPEWLGEHRFYAGVIERLKQVEDFVIISTKEGRFIQQLLADAGLVLHPEQLYGKEQKRPKYAILRELKQHYQSIWFIEDRFKTLQKVIAQNDLADVSLFLADWGYNLPQERQQAADSDRVHLIGLEQFCSGFSEWR